MNTAAADSGTGRALDRSRSICQPQIDEFTLESLRAAPTRTLDSRSRSALGTGSRRAMAIDIGGDKLVAALYEASNGLVEKTEEVLRLEALGGRGYLDALRLIAAEARHHRVRMGISYAGPVWQDRAISGLNLPVFMLEFERAYGLDFRKLFDQSVVVNDGEAGAIASAAAARRAFGDVSNIIFVINGSGLNAAAIIGRQVYTTEAGHVKVHDHLNPFGQGKICPMTSPPQVCVEHVASSRAGIEDIWRQQTGQIATGRQIAELFGQGDELATALYRGAAIGTAHLVCGLFRAFDIMNEWSSSMVVCHGGTFNVPGFADCMASVLAEAFGSEPRLMRASEFTNNVCLDGAAYTALTAEPLA